MIAISGISGAGKSTIGQLLAVKLDAVFIDQDWFSTGSKQKCKLSNDEEFTNYDCDDSVNLKNFNDALSTNKHKTIVIAGFNLRDNFFDIENKPTFHFHINIPKELSLLTRLSIKPFSEARKDKEMLVFNEYVYPYYEETLKSSKIDHHIDGCIDGERKPLYDILEEIISLIIL